MIEREIQWPYRLAAMLLFGVMISFTKDANLVITTTPPVIDSKTMVTYTGSFMNGPYGRVSGSVEIIKQYSSFALSLKNFSSFSSPDLHVYLSKEQLSVHLIDPGSLRMQTGNQAYSNPPNVEAYQYTLIYCKAYNHLFGSALLQSLLKRITCNFTNPLKASLFN